MKQIRFLFYSWMCTVKFFIYDNDKITKTWMWRWAFEIKAFPKIFLVFFKTIVSCFQNTFATSRSSNNSLRTTGSNFKHLVSWEINVLKCEKRELKLPKFLCKFLTRDLEVTLFLIVFQTLSCVNSVACQIWESKVWHWKIQTYLNFQSKIESMNSFNNFSGF